MTIINLKSVTPLNSLIFFLILGLSSTVSYGAYNDLNYSPKNLLAPINTNGGPTPPTINKNDESTALPNAYQLIKQLDAQQRETARLASQVEELQLKVDDLTRDNVLLQNNLFSLITTNQNLKKEFLTQIQPIIVDEVNKQVALNGEHSNNKPILDNLTTIHPQNSVANKELNASTRPYLQPRNAENFSTTKNSGVNSVSKDTNNVTDNVTTSNRALNGKTIATPPASTRSNVLTNQNIQTNKLDASNINSNNTNPLTQTPNDNQVRESYLEAYKALKAEGAEAGIEKMSAFIKNYPEHSLAPNANYWLGEFYLKQTPPNLNAATAQFEKVINDYNDYPSNDKQSKALYRLATLAKSQSLSQQAKDYVEQLQTNYPESKEAKLSQGIKW